MAKDDQLILQMLERILANNQEKDPEVIYVLSEIQMFLGEKCEFCFE